MSNKPLCGASVTISIYNPQAQQYQKLGILPIFAVKNQEKLLLLVMKNQQQPFFAIDTTQNVNWTLSQGVYATYVDPTNKVILLQFNTNADLLKFSLLAKSGAALENPVSPIILEKGANAAPINPTDSSVIIDYTFYDFKAPAFDHLISEEGVSMTRDYGSPLQNVFNGGFYDSWNVISMGDQIFALVKVRENSNQAAPEAHDELPEVPSQPKQEQELPKLTEEKPKEEPKVQEKVKEEQKVQVKTKEEQKAQVKEEVHKEENKEKETKKAESKTEKEPQTKQEVQKDSPKETEQQPKTKATNTTTTAVESHASPPQQQKPTVISSHEEVQKTTKPVFDSQLEQIRSEMTQKFNDLSKMIVSLKMQQEQRASAPQSSDILVASVQRLIRENQEKDKLIAEKQQLIELLNARKSDTRERDELRKQLADLTSKVAAQKEATQKKLDEQRRLKDKVEVLKQKIAAAKIDSESRLAAVRRELEAERQKQLSDLDQTKQHLQWSVNKAESEVQELKKKIQEAEAENKRLKERTKTDSAKELEKLQGQADELLQNTVKKMVYNVFQVARQKFQESESYDGSQVIKAVRQILQNQAEEMLEELEGE